MRARNAPALDAGTSVLELMEDAARGSGVVRFLPDNSDPIPITELWRQSGRAAHWLRRRFAPGEAVAALLTSTPACVATMFGAWRAGLKLVSLPHAARGMPLTEHRRQVEERCSLVGAEAVLVDGHAAAALADLDVAAIPFETCGADGFGVLDESTASFVQFTSGATGDPKAVHLELEALGANVVSMLSGVDLDCSFASCSWLPLSHDMGLVGMCLTSIAACGPTWYGTGEITLIATAAFASNPAIWLRAVTDYRATVTTAPAAAFDLVRPLVAGSRRIDLSSLRVCIVGAEPLAAQTLRAFELAARPHGFSERCFCPAYGLAEASLCVTLVRPSQRWRARTVDADALARGEWREIDDPDGGDQAVEVVTSGAPIPGMESRVGGDVGDIAIAGPSLLTGYIGNAHPGPSDGWLETGDVGHLAQDGELYVLGRGDELIRVPSGVVYPTSVERLAAAHPIVRRGQCAAIATRSGYCLVVEHRRNERASSMLRDAGRSIAHEVTRATGCAPDFVLLVAAGTLPRTPSGKLRRVELRRRLECDDIQAILEVS